MRVELLLIRSLVVFSCQVHTGRRLNSWAFYAVQRVSHDKQCTLVHGTFTVCNFLFSSNFNSTFLWLDFKTAAIKMTISWKRILYSSYGTKIWRMELHRKVIPYSYCLLHFDNTVGVILQYVSTRRFSDSNVVATWPCVSCCLIIIIIITNGNVYGAVIMTQSLREFTRFIWWMQTSASARQPPTLRPGQPTWAASPPVGCMAYIRHRHFYVRQLCWST